MLDRFFTAPLMPSLFYPSSVATITVANIEPSTLMKQKRSCVGRCVNAFPTPVAESVRSQRSRARTCVRRGVFASIRASNRCDLRRRDVRGLDPALSRRDDRDPPGVKEQS